MDRAVVVVAALFTVPIGAAAHDYWLIPDTFTPKPGAVVGVRMHVGDAFLSEQEVAFQPKKTAVLQLVTAAGVVDVPALKEAVTDRDGKVSFKLPKAGVWVVRTVHMCRVTEKNPDPPADWESFWAAMTFELHSALEAPAQRGLLHAGSLLIQLRQFRFEEPLHLDERGRALDPEQVVLGCVGRRHVLILVQPHH